MDCERKVEAFASVYGLTLVPLFCDNSLIVDDSVKGGIILIIRPKQRRGTSGEASGGKGDQARAILIAKKGQKDKADARQRQKVETETATMKWGVSFLV